MDHSMGGEAEDLKKKDLKKLVAKEFLYCAGPENGHDSRSTMCPILERNMMIKPGFSGTIFSDKPIWMNGVIYIPKRNQPVWCTVTTQIQMHHMSNWIIAVQHNFYPFPSGISQLSMEFGINWNPVDLWDRVKPPTGRTNCNGWCITRKTNALNYLWPIVCLVDFQSLMEMSILLSIISHCPYSIFNEESYF